MLIVYGLYWWGAFNMFVTLGYTAALALPLIGFGKSLLSSLQADDEAGVSTKDKDV